MTFGLNQSQTSQFFTIRRILGVREKKKLGATILFVDFSKAFDLVHRGKMEQVFLAYPKEPLQQ